jgi:hypothetical protein
MGLFDSLFGTKSASTVELLNDRIWMSQEAKFNGIQHELGECAGSDSVAVVLVAHFPDALERLNCIAAEYSGDTPAAVALAKSLTNDIADSLSLNEAVTIDLIVAERHPLLSIDAQLMQFAEELPCRCRVRHHLALDDPLLKLFVGKEVEALLRKLGMTDDEAIEANMVSRRIKSAQKKIEAQATGNTEAKSATEWIEKNMPSKWKI